MKFEFTKCEFGKALTIGSNPEYGFKNEPADVLGVGAIYIVDVGRSDDTNTVTFFCQPGKYRAPYNFGPHQFGYNLMYDDVDAGCTITCPNDAGYYAPLVGIREKETDCGECPAAHYCPNTVDAPIPCPVGKYAPAKSHRLDQCAACFPGKYMTTGPGKPLLCAVCSAGMFRSSVSLSNTDVCSTCPSGRYNLDHTSNAFDSSSDKSTAAAFHNELTDCLFCAVGRSFTTQTTTCDICGGKYRLSHIFSLFYLCSRFSCLLFFLFSSCKIPK